MVGPISYLILFVVVGVLFYLAQREQQRGTQLAEWLLVIVLIIFSGLRVGPGRDFEMYHRIFVDPSFCSAQMIEPIWRAISSVLRSIGCGYYAWQTLIASATIMLFYSGVRRMSYSVPLAMLFYVAIYKGYFEPMNMVRQQLAMMIVFASYPWIQDRKYGQFALGMLVAALFHRSALAFPLLLLLVKMKWHPALLLSALGVTFLFGARLFELSASILSSFLPDRYGFHFFEENRMGYSTGFYQLFINGVAVVVLFLSSRLSRKDTLNQEFAHYFVWSVIIYNYSIMFLEGARLSLYASMFVYPLLANLIVLSKTKWFRLVVWLIILAYFCFTLKDILNPNEPYSTYQTWFSNFKWIN